MKCDSVVTHTQRLYQNKLTLVLDDRRMDHLTTTFLITRRWLWLLAFSTLLLSPPSLADWSLDKDKDGIQIFTRSVDGSGFKMFKGVMTLNATTDSILAVMADLKEYSQWVDRSKSAKLIKRISFHERYAYQISSLPWPVKNRDMVIHTRISHDTDKQRVTISLNAVTGMMQETKSVRVTQSQGTYLIESLADGRHRISWQQHTDPAGSMPKWLVNTLLTELPFNTLNALRERVKLDKYSQSKLQRDSSGKIVGWSVKRWE